MIDMFYILFLRGVKTEAGGLLLVVQYIYVYIFISIESIGLSSGRQLSVVKLSLWGVPAYYAKHAEHANDATSTPKLC